MWLTATVAALATAAWVSWGVGPGHGGLTYGLVQGLRAAGTSLALGTRWRMPTRVIVAASIAAAAAVTQVIANQ
jgi:hypothetical protein